MIPTNPTELHPSLGPGRADAARAATYPLAPPPGVYLPVPLPQAGDRPALPPALSSALTPQALLGALRRRWMRAALLGVLAATAAATTTYLVYPSIYPPGPAYTAVMELVIDPAPQYNLYQHLNESKDGGSFNQIQLHMIKSRQVANAALKYPGVANLPSVQAAGAGAMEHIQSAVSPSFGGGGDMFLNISVSGDDEKEVKLLAEAVTEAYLQEIVLKEHNKRLARIDKLRDLAQRYEDRIRQKNQTIERMIAKAKAVSAGGPKRAELLEYQLKGALALKQKAEEELIAIKGDKVKRQIELKGLEAQMKALEGTEVAGHEVDALIREDALFQKYHKEIADWEAQVELIKKTVQPAAFPRESLRAREGAKHARAALKAYVEEIRPQIAEQLYDQKVGETQRLYEDIKGRIAFAELYAKELEFEIERLEELTQTIGEVGVDVSDIQEAIAMDANIVQTARAEAYQLEVERNSPPRVRKMEDEVLVVANEESSSKRHRLSLLAGLAALAVVLLGISWWEWRAKRIATVDEVVHGLGLTVFGALPAWRRGSANRLIGAKPYRELHWQSLFTESVDATRTMLLHTARQERLRVVMVSSAVSGEGKTSLSSHLATSLARANRRTLLLDCDLRNPAAHKLFDLPVTPGVCEVLRGDVDLAAAIKPTAINGLWMLTAGRCDDRVLQALAQDDLRRVLDQLKEQFEFIVVDSSPVLPVADALLVGQHVDAVLFSILRDVSRVPMVYTAYQRLAVLGIRMLGAVVNGAREEMHGYGYGSPYGYEYGEDAGTPAPEDGAAAPADATAVPPESSPTN